MPEVIPIHIDDADVTGTDLARLQEAEATSYLGKLHGGTGINASTLLQLQQGLGLEKGVDIATLSAGKVPLAQLSDSTTGAKGIVALATDLGGTAAAPQVLGLKGKLLPALSVGSLGYDGANWIFTAASGAGTVVPFAGSGNDGKLMVFTNDAGTEASPGPSVENLAKGSVIAGQGTGMPVIQAVSTRGLALVSNPDNTSGLGYDSPHPIESLRQHWSWRPNLYVPELITRGIEPPSTFGYPSLLSSSSGLGMRYTLAGSADGTAAGAGYVGFKVARFDWNPNLVVKFRVGSVLTSQRIWIGWFNSKPYAKNAATTGDHWSALRYVQGTDTTFKSVTCNGTTPTVKDTTVTVTAGQVYELRHTVLGTVHRFYVDDRNTHKTVHSAAGSDNMPTATTELTFFAIMSSQGSSSTWFEIILVDCDTV